MSPEIRDSTKTPVEAVWREESAQLIAVLARMFRDLDLAEDLAQEALVAALEQWPESGVPDNPGAWLTTTAKNRGIDRIRRSRRLSEKYEELAREEPDHTGSDQRDIDAEIDDQIGDELLGLIFVTCDPVLSSKARVALTLKLLGGLSTEEIARAFLTSKSTVAQRVVRAKKTIAESDPGFEVPSGKELSVRLGSVLEVVYLIFNEGYAATAGEDLIRSELCGEAIRLGGLLADLAPNEPEAHGLLALMAIQASRSPARTGPGGEPILLLDQDRSLWDRDLIRKGLNELERANELSSAEGPYTLQAEIAACHARAEIADDTDWQRIADLYRGLSTIAPSPVVELNRAVAVGMSEGPAAGLEIADHLTEEPLFRRYHLLPAVRADLLERLGRGDEAAAEYSRAARLTSNGRQRVELLERAELASSETFENRVD